MPEKRVRSPLTLICSFNMPMDVVGEVVTGKRTVSPWKRRRVDQAFRRRWPWWCVRSFGGGGAGVAQRTS